MWVEHQHLIITTWPGCRRSSLSLSVLEPIEQCSIGKSNSLTNCGSCNFPHRHLASNHWAVLGLPANKVACWQSYVGCQNGAAHAYSLSERA